MTYGSGLYIFSWGWKKSCLRGNEIKEFENNL